MGRGGGGKCQAFHLLLPCLGFMVLLQLLQVSHETSVTWEGPRAECFKSHLLFFRMRKDGLCDVGMLIGSVGLQIPSVLSHVFNTGWGAELLNFFFSSGGQGLEVAKDYMWTELGGLGKILRKQCCSSKRSTMHSASVCPYYTNRVWTPLMCVRNKLFPNKCFYNHSGKEGPGEQRKWDSGVPICWWKLGRGVGEGSGPLPCLT